MHRFGNIVRLLVHSRSFPLPDNIKTSFVALENEIESVIITSIDPEIPLVVKTNASDIAVSSTFLQNRLPVEFFSRTLSRSGRHHSSMKKKASAIVEAIRNCGRYLLGTDFRLGADQKSIDFAFNSVQLGNIMKDTIHKWRIELSGYSFDVIYLSSHDHVAAGTLSRSFCSATTSL